MKKVSTKALALLLAMMMTVTVFAGCSSQTATQSATAGKTADKTINVQVVHGDGSSKDFEIATDAETLRAAMEQENLIEGDESEYGLYVKTVDGETADESKQEWWAITQDGEMTDAVDKVELTDGDHYEFTLTTGW